MSNPRRLVWQLAAVAGACALLALVPLLLNRLARRYAESAPSPGAGPDPSMRGTVRSRVDPREEAAVLDHPTPPIAAATDDLFEDVSARAGLKFVHQFCDTRIANILESNGAGGAILDYDGDGWPDIFLVNSGPLEGVTGHKPGTRREPDRLFRNRRDGTFEDVSARAGLGGGGYSTAAAAADFDNDGHTDLLVVNVGRPALYRNRGDGTFEDVTARSGLGHSGTGISAVWLDLDNDGLLDLFIANYLTYDPGYKPYFASGTYPGPLSYQAEFNMLYRNLGGGRFEDVSERAGIRLPGHRAMSVCALDCNRDGFEDLYVLNDGTPNNLLVNDGKGRFTDQAARLGVAFNSLGEAAGSMAASVGDCNGDGLPDIVVSRLGYGSLYLATPAHLYTDQMMASRLGEITRRFVGWGCGFMDFDNDGDLDILMANGDAHHLVGWESLLIENDGRARFTDASRKGGRFFQTKVRARGSATLDLDRDGRMDFLITALGDRPFLLRNREPSGRHWLLLDLVGTRANRDGFGARVTLTAAGRKFYQEAHCPIGFLMQSDKRLHFGLGDATTVESLRIVWPSGSQQDLTGVRADQVLTVREPAQ